MKIPTLLLLLAFASIGTMSGAPAAAQAQTAATWEALYSGHDVDPRLPAAVVEPGPMRGDAAFKAAFAELVAANLNESAQFNLVDRRRTAFLTAQIRASAKPYDALPRFHAVQWVISPTWISIGNRHQLEVTVVDVTTGRVRARSNVVAVGGADIVAIARRVAALVTAALAAAPGAEPAGLETAPEQVQASGIPAAAVESFSAGVQLEIAGRWDDAAAAHERAVQDGGPAFREAAMALARVRRIGDWARRRPPAPPA